MVRLYWRWNLGRAPYSKEIIGVSWLAMQPHPAVFSGSESAVLYGIGSPILSDFEDLLSALGVKILVGIRNIEGSSFASSGIRVQELAGLSFETRQLPTFFPFTGASTREHIVEEAVLLGFFDFPALIHPSAIVPPSTTLSRGLFVGASVTFGARSTLGQHAFVNRGAILGHHNELKEYSTVGPGVVSGGNVTFERSSSVGLGARLLPGVRIGRGAVVGAGAVVTRDVAPYSVVAGNPAKPIEQRTP